MSGMAGQKLTSLSAPSTRRRLLHDTSPLSTGALVRNAGKEVRKTYNAELSNLSECSLNLRMSGSAPR